jgi:trigger factor
MKFDLQVDPQFPHVYLLKVSVHPEDYIEEVEKQLKKYRQQYFLPGFRPGHVPMSIVRKKFYASTVLTKATDLVEEKVFDYIRDQQIKYFFQPILTEVPSLDSINPEVQPGELIFGFKIPLIPAEEIDFKKIAFPPYYQIEIAQEDIDKEVERWQKEYGKLVTSKPVEDNSILFVQIKVPEHTSIAAKQAYLMPIVSKASAPKLIEFLKDKEKGVTVSVVVKDVFNSKEEAEPVLRLKEDQMNEIWDEMVDITIMETYVQEPATINQELFNKVFPNENITDEDGFRKRIASSLDFHYKRESNYIFVQSLMDEILKVYPILYSEDIYRSLYESIAKKELRSDITDDIKKAFDKIVIEDKLISQLEISVDDDHLTDYLKRIFLLDEQAEDFTQKLDQIFNSIKQDERGYKNLIEDVKYELLVNALLEKYDVQVENISTPKFVEILQNKDIQS